jgi:hypothetical protein
LTKGKTLMWPVQRDDGRWSVVSDHGETIVADLPTNEAAWRWVDNHTDEGRADIDKHRRIRSNFE